MSMRALPPVPVPEATALVARAAFPDGCLAMRLRDEFGVLYQDQDFVDMFARIGGPSRSPGMLALVSVLQYVEQLSDRAAADAVRGRIDWKYALGLELTDPGFHYSVLSQFRDRLIAHSQEAALLDVILQRCREAGLLRSDGRVRSDSTHVVGRIRDLNRLELVTETMRCALEALAVAAPDWLAAIGAVNEDWAARYTKRADFYRLPKGEPERVRWAENVGGDGFELLDELRDPYTPQWLAGLPAVVVLERVWAQEYIRDEKGVRFLEPGRRVKGAERIVSPHDLDARAGAKQEHHWDGYKAHLTETCDAGAPHLIVRAAATPASADDATQTTAIHDDLAEHGIHPSEHFADTGYSSAKLIVQARTAGIDLVAPVKLSNGRQARTNNGYATHDFTIDWDTRTVTCPKGKTSTRWIDTFEHGEPRIHIDFYNVGCLWCPAKSECTTAKYRALTLRPREQHELLEQRRAQMRDPVWKQRYHTRAGVEGTMY
jgi:transposase